jgi:membrane protein implicated in regulation of membrane protease activity
MIATLPNIEPYWYWFALALIVATLEIFVSGFFLIWLAIGAALAGGSVLIFPSMSWHFPLIIFALTSLGSLLLWRRYARSRPAFTDHPMLNQRAQRYIGKTAPLTEATHQGMGKIRLDDTVWLAKSNEEMAKGTLVTITGFDSCTFTVEKAPSELQHELNGY